MSATVLVSGTFTATGQSSSFRPIGKFNVVLRGTFVATVTIDRSFDGGSTWGTISRDSAGTSASYTAPAGLICEEVEGDTLYRLNCTAYTSGTVTYRASQ
jgi:hypothetical protein